MLASLLYLFALGLLCFTMQGCESCEQVCQFVSDFPGCEATPPEVDTNKVAQEATDPIFKYIGRWETNNSTARAQWACSTVVFNVTVDAAPAELELILNPMRTQAAVYVGSSFTPGNYDTTVIDSVFGESYPSFDAPAYAYKVPIKQAGTFQVAIGKQSGPAPYGNGPGNAYPSELYFFGLGSGTKGAQIISADLNVPHKMVFVGAGNTMGFCAAGTEKDDAKVEIEGVPSFLKPIVDQYTGDIDIKQYQLNPYTYGDCFCSHPSILSTLFEAELQNIGSPGIGITRNADDDQKELYGPDTISTLYNRTMMTLAKPLYLASDFIPDIIVNEMGSNDFNNDGTPEEFQKAYNEFTAQLIQPYMDMFPDDPSKWPVILNACGMGSPNDGDVDRCKHCADVEKAATDFKTGDYADVNNNYLLVPCDGSVVRGVKTGSSADIGCGDSLNCLGQQQVAAFMQSHIAELMQWNSRRVLSTVVSPDGRSRPHDQIL